ncbi:MAG: sulfotransferase family protein [Gammaproteobacteria bacterium]
MTIQVLGAGLGRTGTMSLKLALERLLGGRCYHMTELFQHLPAHIPYWQAAAKGEPVDWNAVFGDYVAAVDEPTAFLWETLMDVYPDALVILSMRDADEWWRSADATIMDVKRVPPAADDPDRVRWYDMIMTLYNRLYPGGIDDAEGAKAAFRDHVERVKAAVPSGRLLVWEVGDGWRPICDALGLPVPDEPFPNTNSREEFLARRAARKTGQ